MATGAKLPTMNGTNPGRVKFGPFEADLYTHEIWKHGVKIKLVGQPFEVLAILLNRPGELVTREELHERLWPGDTFVDFDHGLNAAVNKLREALSDSVETPRYVETLPRRGYRFIATVQEKNAAVSAPSVAVPAVALSPSPLTAIPGVAPPDFLAKPDAAPNTNRLPRLFLFGGLFAVLLVILFIGLAWIKHRDFDGASITARVSAGRRRPGAHVGARAQAHRRRGSRR